MIREFGFVSNSLYMERCSGPIGAKSTYICDIGALVCFVELRFWQKLLFVVQHAFEMQE